MKGRSALPRGAFALALLTVALGAAGSVWGRDLLARLPYFDVRQVEVTGARYVAPDSIVALAAIGEGRSVWEDFADIEQRLASHPLIEAIEVRRRGAHALRLVVEEVQPVALIDLGTLRAVDPEGTVLPVDPLGAPVDLPVMIESARTASDSGALADGAGRAALGQFVRLRALDPGLAAVVSDFGLAPNGGLRANLMTSEPAEQLWLPPEVDEVLVRRIRASLADLRSRGILAHRVDARFADQVVVHLRDAGRAGDRREREIRS